MPQVKIDIDRPEPPNLIREALLDFSPRRPQRWPGIESSLCEVYRVGPTDADVREGSRMPGGLIWAKEHYDWSTPGTCVPLTTCTRARPSR